MSTKFGIWNLDPKSSKQNLVNFFSIWKPANVESDTSLFGSSLAVVLFYLCNSAVSSQNWKCVYVVMFSICFFLTLKQMQIYIISGSKYHDLEQQTVSKSVGRGHGSEPV